MASYSSGPVPSYLQRPGAQQQPAQWDYTDIGSQNAAGELYNPATGGLQRTGAQKGTDAGQALKALQEASGLNLLGSSSSSGSGSGFGLTGPFGVGGTFPTIAAPDTTAATDAIFARAKDKTGQVGASALQGMREALAGRGMLGAGAERQGTEQLAEAGQGVLGNVIREQAIQAAQQAQRNAEAGYQGAITQRGQDVSMYGNQLDAQQREAQRQAQMLEGLLSVLPQSLLY